MLLFFTDLAALPDLFILEMPLFFDLLEIVSFLSTLFLMSFWDVFTDLLAADFLLLRLLLLLWLLTVPPSSSGSASQSSFSGSISI